MIRIDFLNKFENQMKNTKIKKRKIRSDITVVYDRTDIHYLYTTNNIEAYRHLMNCYGLSEKELKEILYDIKNPDKELMDEDEAENGA